MLTRLGTPNLVFFMLKSLSQTIYDNDFDCGKRFGVTQFLFSFDKHQSVVYRYVADFRDPDGDLLYIIAAPNGHKFILAEGRQDDLIIPRCVHQITEV